MLSLIRIDPMSFAKRFVALRKSRNMTQAQMAKLTGVHLSQIKRYEQGDGEPSMGVIRKFARSLHVTADELIFDDAEREPDGDLKLMFEAVDQFDADDKQMAKKVIQGLIIQNQTKRWSASA